MVSKAESKPFRILRIGCFLLSMIIFIEETIMLYNVSLYDFLEKKGLTSIFEYFGMLAFAGPLIIAPLIMIVSAVSINYANSQKLIITSTILSALVIIEFFAYHSGLIGQFRK